VSRRPALRRARWLGMCLLPLATACLTTGCFRGVFHITVNRDGSMDADYRAGVFPALAGFVRDRMAAAAGTLRAEGFTVSHYAEGRYVGVRAAKHMPTNVWARPAAVRSSAAPGAVFRTEVRDGLFFRTLVGRLHADLSAMMPGETAQVVFTEDALQMVDIRFVLTLPYRVGAGGAASLLDGGRTVEWRLQPGTVTDVAVVVRRPRARRLAVAAALVIAAGAAGVLGRSRLRRRGGRGAR
jgi:hypothetical protein